MRVSPVMEHAFLHQHRIQQERTLMMPLGDHEFTPVAMMDVCEALVCMASKMMSARQDTDCGDCGGVGGAHHVITYCCTGKEPMTAKRMAEAASKALGTQIQHREVSWDEFKRELEQHGHLQEHEMECAREMMEMIKRDMMKEVTQDLQKLLKREPMTVVQFFEHHQDSFKPRQ
ncbi:hypothetical protein H4R35_006337 [Dimargaris xerosporica]|nr:hypothetical protein H4R35_006337 [Dimargaris xerosporica]